MEDPVAQLVEQLPFKPWVEGSSPSRITFYKNLSWPAPYAWTRKGFFLSSIQNIRLSSPKPDQYLFLLIIDNGSKDAAT